jgi:predicted GNAT family acetyltransferase
VPLQWAQGQGVAKKVASNTIPSQNSEHPSNISYCSDFIKFCSSDDGDNDDDHERSSM